MAGETLTKLVIDIEDQQSLVHLGSLDSFDITEGGKQAAELILRYLKRGRMRVLEQAIDIYETIIPHENFGGEYTALEWFCRFWLAPEDAREAMLTVPMTRAFYDELAADDYEPLKLYLTYKYHIKEYKDDEEKEAMKPRMRYLEDFILFNNPDRERWESTRQNLEKVGLKPGMRIADVGSGPGYYTFKFADIVGDEGRVFASETNPRHIDFLRRYVRDNGVKNVEVVESSFNGIGLPEDIHVDVVYMCSLYHNVYAAFTDAERDAFVGSIRHALYKVGNRLVIVDNDLVTNGNMPYHGPYINKWLISAQLWHYGFELEDTFQFTPQRYVLIFRMREVPEKPKETVAPNTNAIAINSATSVVRYRIIGTSTSGYTCRGKVFGRIMHEGLVEHDGLKLVRAREGFEDLWPKERIGDDYTAFIWLITYWLADEAGRRELTEDPLTRTWAAFWCDDDFANLKTYLHYKFDLALPDDPNASIDMNFEYAGDEFPIARLNKWNEYLIFNNPNRVAWEHTDEMIDFFEIRPGERIADIGCGGGYFSWQFSKLVGETGQVFATEINEGAISYLKDFVEAEHVTNICPLITKLNDTGLDEGSVDTIFMCSCYHAVYITDIEFVKDAFLASIHKALVPGGRLIIVDNAVTEADVVPYYGPGIRPELIVSQLSYYGFELKRRWQVTPQRFALVFEEVAGYVAPPAQEIEEEQPKGEKRHGAKHLLQVLRNGTRGGGPNWGHGGHERPEDDHRNDY